MDLIQHIEKAQSDCEVNITVVVNHSDCSVKVHAYSNERGGKVRLPLQLEKPLQKAYPHKVEFLPYPYVRDKAGHPVYGIKTPLFLNINQR